MSHLSRSTSDSEDEWDGEPTIVSVAIPGPNASKGDLMEALKALQVQVQKLVKDNCTLREENKVLIAEKPKCKCCTEAPDELLAHKQTITLYARKYGMTIEVFPNAELLSKQRPENPTPFNSQDQYLTAITQESAFLDELFQHFPSCLHSVMESSYFSNLVTKCISEARSSEINKLHGMYFNNTNYRRADVAEIWDMLGVSARNPKYKTFLPVLFLGMQEDPSLKTMFGNWELLAKILKVALHGITSLHQETTGGPKTNAWKWNFEHVTPGSIVWAAVISIFLLLPDTEFQKSGLGKSSGINYKDLFFHYKKLLLMKWDSRRIQTIVQNINQDVFGSMKSSASAAGQEDHSSEIICAINALDMDTDSKSDVSTPSSEVQGAAASRSDIIEVVQPPECPTPTLSTVSSISTLSAASIRHVEVPIQGVAACPVATTTVVVQDMDIGQQPAQGRGKTRTKKPAAEGVRRGTRQR
ncbi:hypothetical protein BDR05DRAFT_942668 [Suillus weaverae]|nr:hypothetical protein BDR05DRAFT_942668 [Suillus weaverae]